MSLLRPLRRLVGVFAVTLCAGGCGVSYGVLRHSGGDAGLRGAPVLSVPELQFQVPPPESPEEWANHVAAWDAAYAEALANGVTKLGVTTFRRLAPGEVAREGTVVVSVVREIKRGNFMNGDHLVAEVQVIDAASGQPRAVGELEVNSTGVGPEGYTFGGRIKFASINLARAIADVLGRGTFER